MEIAHLHFLVAESDAAERHSLVDALSALGATRITQAADGDTAWRLLHEACDPGIDVAIVDLDLAGRDGLDLVRSSPFMAGPTRLVVTGRHDATLMFSVETMALAYGIDLLGTVSSPVSGAQLEALLTNYAPAPEPAPARILPAFSFADIGAALEERQFEPFFQPKIELDSGDVKGLEVFARWRHPEHGVLSPRAFIDALEENNRIDFLDWTMIEGAAACSRTFREQGLPDAISINLAPETLAHPDFVQQIWACVERHGVRADAITFEMPESAVLTDDPAFLERLVRLRMMGYGLAIDDYGTGRSNLQLLARVPFTELKIDRSFVDGASRKRSLATVLKSCMGLAQSLGRKSVAVGVETRRDWDFLQGLGCTYAQGYHIAKPMEAERFEGWLSDWRQFF